MISSLASVGSMVFSALPCRRWLLIQNPSAGRFGAPEAALRIAEALHQSGQEVAIHETNRAFERRAEDIAAIIRAFRPSLCKPLGVIALGGDGTTNDALRGILHFIFSPPGDLISGSPDSAVNHMLDSGIQMGTVRMGGSSQLGQLYGAPSADIADILHYLGESCVTSLNLGLVSLSSGASLFFSHNTSAGTLNAPVYESTKGERGFAARYHQKALGLWNLCLHRDPFRVAWSKDGGPREEAVALEILAHATPRARNTNGLPGTLQPGIGLKIIPDMRFRDLIHFSREIKERGRLVAQGDFEAIAPWQKLQTLEPALQPALEVGEEMSFSFWTLKGARATMPVQANADFLGWCQELRVRALPSFPRFLVRWGATMDLFRKFLSPS